MNKTLRMLTKCNICESDENKISAISGLTIKSRYSTYELGRMEEVNYCPKCGRKLRRTQR